MIAKQGRAEPDKWANVGFIADDGPGCFEQWLGENPKASKRQVIGVAFLLLQATERQKIGRLGYWRAA